MNESWEECLCHWGEVKLVGKMPALFVLAVFDSLDIGSE